MAQNCYAWSNDFAKRRHSLLTLSETSQHVQTLKTTFNVYISLDPYSLSPIIIIDENDLA